MSPRNLIFAIILGSALAAGIFAAIKSGPKSSSPATPEFAFMLPSPGALPAFSLRDQTGAAVDADTFRGQWDLVFFGFSNCPDICPTTLQVLTSARRKLIRSGSKPVPRIVFVSVDPERDTPDRLGQYVDHFGDGILAVSGDIEEIRKLTTALGMFFQKVPTEAGDYSVDHSAAVLVLDPNGQFAALFSAPQVIDHYMHDLPIILSAR